MAKELSPEMERALGLLRERGGWHYPANVLTYEATLKALERRGLVESQWGPTERQYRAKES